MLRTPWERLSSTTGLGLALTGVGVVADFVHHVFTHDVQAAAVVDFGDIGHVLTLAGMVLAMTGVIRAATQSLRRARQKGERDAARSSSAVTR